MKAFARSEGRRIVILSILLLIAAVHAFHLGSYLGENFENTTTTIFRTWFCLSAAIYYYVLAR